MSESVESAPIVEESVESAHEEQVQVQEEQVSAAEELAPADQDPKTFDEFYKKIAAEKAKRAEAKSAQSHQDELQRYQELKESAKSDPLKLLESFGVDMDDILKAQLGLEPEEEVDEVTKLRREIEAMKEKEVREREEYQARAEQQAIDNHKKQIASLLETKIEDYELINATGKADMVWEVTEAWWEAHGEILTPDQAATKVEGYLYEEYKGLINLNKFKPKPSSEEEETKDEEKVDELVEALEQKKDRFTLSNKNNSKTTVPSKNKTLSEEESLARAAAKLKWNN